MAPGSPCGATAQLPGRTSRRIHPPHRRGVHSPMASFWRTCEFVKVKPTKSARASSHAPPAPNPQGPKNSSATSATSATTPRGLSTPLETNWANESSDGAAAHHTRKNRIIPAARGSRARRPCSCVLLPTWCWYAFGEWVACPVCPISCLSGNEF